MPASIPTAGVVITPPTVPDGGAAGRSSGPARYRASCGNRSRTRSASVTTPTSPPSPPRTGSAVKPCADNRFAAYFTVISGVTVTTGLLMMSRACIEVLFRRS